MGTLEILGKSITAGAGLTMGYLLIMISYQLVLAKLAVAKLTKAVKGLQDAKETASTGSKLCLKCKSAPRPDNGIHCDKCRFDGGDRF